MDYLHYNPAEHRLVERAIDWPHSTFHRYVKKGIYAKDWGGARQPMEGEFGES